MKKEKLPFTEKEMGSFILRTFGKELDEEELKWHFDDENRIVEPIECKGWGIQLDDSLPINMEPGEKYFIPVDVYHRTIKGEGDLKIKLYKLDSERTDSIPFSRVYGKNPEFSDNLLYHVENSIPIHENVFRYGSDAWCDLIQECSQLYQNGKLELSDEEKEFIEDNPGKIVYIEGKKHVLNTPFRNTDDNNYSYFVDVLRDDGSVKRVYFNG